jgi:predicted amidohydrolase
VVLLQITPDADNLEAKAAKAEDFCRRAAKRAADLALMPEMWSIGYTRPDPDQPGSWEAFRLWVLNGASAFTLHIGVPRR